MIAENALWHKDFVGALVNGDATRHTAGTAQCGGETILGSGAPRPLFGPVAGSCRSHSCLRRTMPERFRPVSGPRPPGPGPAPVHVPWPRPSPAHLSPAIPSPPHLSPAIPVHAVIRAYQAAGGGGAYLGTTSDGWVWGGAEHGALVLGPPRSGKSTAIVVPSVVAAPGPVVCTSTKPDIASVTAPLRQRLGPCLVFDPSGTVPPIRGVQRLHWSPVTACHDWDTALIMAASMVDTARRVAGTGVFDGGHWTERAGALLAPLLHAAAVDGDTMETVLQWVDGHQAGPALGILDSAGAEVAGNLLAGIAATDGREQSGIWSTASGTLRAYRSHGALATTASPDFDAAALVEAGATIYVCASARHQAAAAPLVVGLLTEIRAAVYGRAAAWEAAGRPFGTGGAPVLFALDEVANIAPIPDLPSMVSEAGGQGLTVLACLQDLSQARRRWGPDADGFLSLFGNTVILPGIGDVHTLQAVSTLVGDRDVVQRSVTTPVATRRPWLAALAEQALLGRGARQTDDRRPSATLGTARRRRLPVDAIAQGREGAALVLDRCNQARWINLTPWYRTEPWRSAIEAGRERTPGDGQALAPSAERAPAPGVDHERAPAPGAARERAGTAETTGIEW